MSTELKTSIKYTIQDGTSYHSETPKKIIDIIEDARINHDRLRFCFGDTNTGKDWEERYDTTGYIGRSTGPVKIPLLIKRSNSTGGGGVLDHCIVKIERKMQGYRSYVEMYRHPLYNKG